MSHALTENGSFRLRFVACLAIIFIALNAILRITLKAAFGSDLPLSADMLAGLANGAANDCAALSFAILAPATPVLLLPDRILYSRFGKFLSVAAVFAFSAFFAFAAFAEFFFWEEFGHRFNFIAVDYLVYTTELMRNAVESYPLGPVLAAVLLLACGGTALGWKWIRGGLPSGLGRRDGNRSERARLARRFGAIGALYAAAAAFYLLFTPFASSHDRYWSEYAKNGIYELFSAYLNNQLDYRAFYLTMDSREAFRIMRREIPGAFARQEPDDENLVRLMSPRVRVAPAGETSSSASPTPAASSAPAGTSGKTGTFGMAATFGIAGPGDSTRRDRPDGTEGGDPKPNVVIVLMESMGSSWLGELTPGLSALAEHGLSFDRMMSTGTRTVRGIEAVMLSVPPTPGNSIVRRPDNGDLFSLGSIFRRKGYDMDFIYGGLGYFDNMNAFFDANGYRVTDKLGFSRENRSFSNAWGQCDEDLYSESLRLADLSFASGRPFHQVLLTTSNHRPFTFPEGRIGMRQGTREAAVRYADYAVSEYVREASDKAWFADTVFVFVGDHPSSIAGKTEVPPDAYGIVCVMYGPKFFKPERIAPLASQIDVGPTLLAALGWEYLSQFFGTDARELTLETGRAWISTYQLLGFRTESRLAVLKPDASVEVTRIGPPPAPEADDLDDRAEKDALIARAVASYQCAYDLFSGKRMKESAVFSHAMPGRGTRLPAAANDLRDGASDALSDIR